MLSVGIVGLPNVGKSTLFSKLTQKEVSRENYPFCTIDPNVGVVEVPDKRVDRLSDMSQSKKKIYTAIEFVDIAGLIKGASQGEGLGNRFLAHIREVDAILYLLRGFSNPEIITTLGEVSPQKEKEILDMELIMKDLESLEKLKTPTPAQSKCLKILQQGISLRDADLNEQEKEEMKNFLSLKPCFSVINGPEGVDISATDDFSPIICSAYELLNLITFFTSGPEETRAWTLKKGSTAPQAGGVIHSDFESKFIRAEVVHCDDLLALGGFSQTREKGKLRLEGKNYIVQDGDVIVIRHG
jgi:ribosome-binding ATPase